MSIRIEIPEDISRALESQWTDVPRRTLEALASEGYRSGVLSESQVRRMLGFETRVEVHEFLKRAGVPLDYGESDLEHDIETHKGLGIVPSS